MDGFLFFIIVFIMMTLADKYDRKVKDRLIQKYKDEINARRPNSEASES